ncbi:MAG: hypothetical protein ACHRHE_19875 [Tepidisphaerales bacterium]
MLTYRLMVCVVVCLAAGWSASGQVQSLKVDGTRFVVNGKPLRLWGVRVAGAANREEYTSELLNSLETLKKNDINALVVYYQGSTGQSLKTFSGDGKSFAEPGVHQRMLKIIEAARAKDMLVIAGLFFPRRMGSDGQDPKLDSREAYIQATRLVASQLKDCPNVILSIAHEPGRANWLSAPIKWTPEDALACLETAASAAPNLPRGCGGSEHALNAVVAASDLATVILHSEAGVEPPKFPQNKPSVNICLFGRDSGGRDTQGAWSDPDKRRFYAAMDKYLGSERDHLVAHFQGWTEGGMDLKRNRFDLGGAGTAKDPGLAWYFDALNDRLHPLVRPATGTRPAGGKSIFDP